jgi:hypothetical protein
MTIIEGNVVEGGNPIDRGWFIGQFIEGNSVFNNDSFEMKWTKHSKGKIRKVPAKNVKAKSMCILVEGNFVIRFPDEKSEKAMTRKGDFIFWGPEIYHTSEALEDSVVLTIRWPSIKDDQRLRPENGD